MKNQTLLLSDSKALEKAAKYICNLKDGLCPMVVEKMACNALCTHDTLPWHCWLNLFKKSSAAEPNSEDETA